VKERKKKERRIDRKKERMKERNIETVNVKRRVKVYFCGSHYEERKVHQYLDLLYKKIWLFLTRFWWKKICLHS
jgi:hypothetical protein